MASNNIPYFRFYPADFMNGVRGLSAQEIGVYTMILCRIYESSGPVEYNPLRLATYCGMRQATFDKVIEKLVDLDKLQMMGGMISNGRAEIEISKRSNDLKLNSKAGKVSAEKRQQNQGKGATDVQRTFNHTDTDTDTVKEEGKPSSKKARASRLSGDWFLPQQWGEWAVTEGCTIEQVRSEADKFKDYWHSKAGAAAAKMDWQATWRNWIRSALEKTLKFKAINGGRYDPSNPNPNQLSQGRGNRPNAAIEQIARLAGLGQPQGAGSSGIGGLGEEDGSVWLGTRPQ